MDAIMLTDEQVERVRTGLRRLTRSRLILGMRAFDRKPDGSSEACFCAALSEPMSWSASIAMFGEVFGEIGCRCALSFAYEVATDWLHAECIRELAERGEHVETGPVERCDAEQVPA